MSILNTAVSGMLANTSWLTTISQNVANANTTGYKNVETEFDTLVDSAVNTESSYAGVQTSSRSLNSLQGQIEQTTSTTDLAVKGAGYFVVSDSAGDIFLTRDGSFIPDSSGNLVNAAGYYLMGQPVSESATSVNSLSSLTKVNVTNAGDQSIPSTDATIVANLPSTATAEASAFLPSNNNNASTFTAQTSLVAYDNLGAPHTINFYYTKTADNTWEVDAYDAANASAGGGFPYSTGALATQTLTFSSANGSLSSGSPLTLNVPGGQTLTIDMSQTTQLASAFAVSTSSINGNAPGTVTGVSVATDGTLSYEYGSGSVTSAYKIPLAKVESPDNLTSVAGDAFQANASSGVAQIGIPGSAGLGSIESDSLESSTVDLATELTNMVQAQSSYEANSKVFRTGAKLLDVLNNIQA